MTCVGLDVRSFWSPAGFDPPADRTLVRPVGEDWIEITSPLLRSVRTAEVIAAAFDASRAAIDGALGHVIEDLKALGVSDAVADELGPQLEHLLTPEAPKRRGPKPQLDETALRDVVAQAYLTAARKPVQAVRQALEDSGLLRPPVTPDQARKAVVNARARGFIPPATRARTRAEEQR